MIIRRSSKTVADEFNAISKLMGQIPEAAEIMTSPNMMHLTGAKLLTDWLEGKTELKPSEAFRDLERGNIYRNN